MLQKALPMMQAKNVWSRGRFGSYKYEVREHTIYNIYIYIYIYTIDIILFKKTL